MPKTFLPFLFCPDELNEQFNKQCIWFFRERLGMEVSADLQFNVPDDLGNYRRQNQTLKAQLTLCWSNSDKPIELSFPAPYHGVFVLRSSDSNQSKLRYWFPTLIEIPGEWLIREDDNRSSIVLKNAYPGNRVRSYKRSSRPSWNVKPKPIMVASLSKSGLRLIAENEIEDMDRLFSAKLETSNENQTTYDEQSLAHLRLQTFNVYILENFLKTFINILVADKNLEIEKYILSGELGYQQKQQEIWDSLVKKTGTITNRFFPVHFLKKYGRLKLFNPLNNIDSVSLLTSFRKIRQQKSYNPITHQNHPSYRNIICPIETPESAEVGLNLHLAAGAQTDIWGKLYPSSDKEEDYLGLAASLVPFYQHNDAVRVMMGAKNLRQAVNICDAAPPMIKTSCEQEIVKLNEPLIERNLLENQFSEYKPGKDLLVAYMPWYGYNFEDAIVANSDLRERGGLTYLSTESFEVYLKPGFLIDKSDLIGRIGKFVHNGCTIAQVIVNGEHFPFRHTSNTLGTLADIQYHSPENPICGGKLEWSIQVSEPLQVGSKLMARYGNKGVISKFISPDEMPKFPNDERLPKKLRGKAVDLLLNPHGVISRMNMGQLMETQFTMAHDLGVDISEILGKRFEYSDPMPLSKFFEQNPPFDKYGRINLEFGKGKRTKSPVVVGYQYFTVLKQIPSKKAHARGGHTRLTPYNTVTGQPVEGKARNGGQRIGEMEFWALAAHQADNIIKEFLLERSDPAFAGSGNQTTQAILDHLFFLGFKFDQKGNVQKVSDEEIVENCIKIESSDTRYCADVAIFQCPKCDYKLMDGSQLESNKSSERSKEPNINIKSLFDSKAITIGYANELIFNIAEVNIEKELEVSSSVGPIWFSLTRNKSSVVKAVFNIQDNQFVATKRISKDVFIEDIFNLFIVCPHHTAAKVVGKNAQKRVKTFKNGLYDEDVFGQPIPDNYGIGWGYIDLKTPLSHPADKTGVIRYLPILPLKYRFCNPNAFLTSSEENEITAQYANIIRLVNDKGDHESLQKHVNSLYWDVQRKVFGRKNRGKYGLIRRHGLGRRIDYSGRLVLVPDPSLEWDEVSLPSSVCSVLFGKKANAYADDSETQTFLERCESFPNYPMDDSAIISTISKFIQEENPRVLVNRAPTLHKYNIMSFRPKPHLIKDGLVIKLNPIVFKGFGADADGDEMSIHVLKNPESLIESARLSPDHPSNLLSIYMRESDTGLETGQPVVDFDQDWILGNYLLNNYQRGTEGVVELKNILESDRNYKQKIVDKMRASFKKVTEDGVSFSYLELVELALKISPTLNRSYSGKGTEFNSTIEEQVNTIMEDCVDHEGNPGHYFAAMALSGARGSKQTRQILGARGYLEPGPMGFEEPPEKYFIIQESLLEGMKPQSAYMSTYNARSSMIDKNMGTYSAGYLTRQLVLTLWPWKVLSGDCGKGSIASCEYIPSRQVCSTCYGLNVPDGYPAGLIAAQAIGERCTQLIMSSFHTGQSVSPLEEIKAILDDRKNSLDQFTHKVSQIQALSEVLPQHVRLIWVVLNSLDKFKIVNAFNKLESAISATANNGGFGRLIRDTKDEGFESLNNSHPVQNLLLSTWEVS
jgi:hypothetical protein